MKIGVTTFLADEGIRPASLAKALEERAFESLLLHEHSHVAAKQETPFPGGGELPRMYYRTLDPFVALTAAATVTDNLVLGTGVALLVQRDVIHTAKQVASLDLVSDGRVLFGVGTGWSREEMRNHGTDPRTRGKLLNEQLAAIKEIWTSEQAEFHGEYIDFAPIFCWPKPVQRPHPPIFIGGDGEAALARVAAHGDGWMPHSVGNPARVRAQLNWVTEVAGDVPVTVASVAPRPELIAAYAEAGADRVALSLPTQPEAETLRMLDMLAALVGDYR
ncbi:TIGR03619 family F420-dependent LLM class oxidoreductase [Streptomyces fagopyri]|uniref:TIGR03619 family F420-dependent LLM class oxidoreductase n=1 Tax=Streptomyces fagopyri TaxID=2662397 RepID=A0A5Q0L5I2_9ACTN|nr:LLM class F420-dependent oxidoreductase [Streptomyces fagopyri]QFZ72034.1 TIGR03619 family F420-dependent LLM class oxidoreductase [Streptomyces fagopyri]